jgi:hypothetical protein
MSTQEQLWKMELDVWRVARKSSGANSRCDKIRNALDQTLQAEFRAVAERFAFLRASV